MQCGTRQPVLAACALVVVGLGGCGRAAPTLTDADDDRIRTDVRALLDQIPAELAADGPMGWLRFFEDSPSFFMASDGLMPFASVEAAEEFLVEFGPTVTGMTLEWQEVRIEPLAPGAASFAASYQEEITMADGTVSAFGGHVSGVVRDASGTWKLQHLHWSSPVATPE